MYSVEVANLTKIYGKFKAVDNISFSVNKGEIFGFLGPNGAGKSTTIKMLCGITQPTSGSGHAGGFDIKTEQKMIKSNIGYMSQKFSLYDDLSVIENLEFFGNIYGIRNNELNKRIDAVLEMAEIGENKNVMVARLPIGIKQRLSLGGAILHDPSILFLDEPTSGVDPIMRRNFWELIYRFSSEGKTIFVTTHYMDEAEHCDRIALIISGGIMAIDSPSGLKNSLQYSVYTLKVKDFIHAFDIISGLDSISEASIFGNDIHILCKSDMKNPENIIKDILIKNGFSDITIKKIKPSLEDVFVTAAKAKDNKVFL